MIDLAIQKLIQQGYLNDRLFARSYINTEILTTNHGPNRIRNDLCHKMVDETIITQELENFTLEKQNERVKKIIDYRIKINRTRAGNVLKRKIFNDLLLLGYDSFCIQEVLNTYSFPNDPCLVKKEYDKLYRRYSSKYSGDELKRKIREKMYLKGFAYEEE